jgi:hypothetical protein
MTTGDGTAGHPLPSRRGRLFWAALVVGWGIMGYGFAGILANTRDTRPSDLARWFLGSALVHDALIAPSACLAGVAIARLVPGRWRGLVSGALVVTGVVTIFSIPLVRRYGVRPDNPTVIFRDYGPALLVVLAAVWVATGLLALLILRRPTGGHPSAERERQRSPRAHRRA